MSSEQRGGKPSFVQTGEPATTAKAVLDVFHARAVKILEGLVDGHDPREEDLFALERLSRLASALADDKADKMRSRKRTAAVIGVCALLLLLVSIPHVGTTHVELDVQANAVHLRANRRATLLVPGEWSEVVMLKSAVVSRVAHADPKDVLTGDVAVIEATELGVGAAKQENPVRLQRLEIPHGDSRLDFEVTYANGHRGVAMTASPTTKSEWTQPMTALFARMIRVPTDTPVGDVPAGDELQLEPITLQSAGREAGMTAEMFPSDASHMLAVVRNLRVVSIDFGTGADESAALHGSVTIADASPRTREVLAGEHVSVTGDIIVRELVFHDDVLSVKLSVDANSLELGTPRRSAMPTWLDFLRARWPADFYGSLLGLVGMCLAVVGWWNVRK